MGVVADEAVKYVTIIKDILTVPEEWVVVVKDEDQLNLVSKFVQIENFCFGISEFDFLYNKHKPICYVITSSFPDLMLRGYKIFLHQDNPMIKDQMVFGLIKIFK